MIIQNVIRILLSYFIVYRFYFLVLFPTINNRIEENVNRSSDETIPMECDQQASMISSSHIDDDIIEIEGLLNIFYDTIRIE